MALRKGQNVFFFWKIPPKQRFTKAIIPTANGEHSMVSLQSKKKVYMSSPVGDEAQTKPFPPFACHNDNVEVEL